MKAKEIKTLETLVGCLLSPLIEDNHYWMLIARQRGQRDIAKAFEENLSQLGMLKELFVRERWREHPETLERVIHQVRKYHDCFR